MSYIWFNSVFNLKMIEKGFSKGELASIDSQFFVIDLLIIFVIGQFDFHKFLRKSFSIPLKIFFFKVSQYFI